VSLIVPKNFNIKNPEASTYLLFFAIVIEIGVAGLAIFLGLLIANAGSNELEVSFLNRLISPLLFIVIAIIELTRVPLLISIYRGNNFIWRIFGSFFLIAIMFLAFETLMTAFQMNGAMVTGNIDKNIIDKNTLSEKVNILENQIKDLSTLTLDTINEEYDREMNLLSGERKIERNNINNEIKSINLSITNSSSGALSNKQDNFKDQLNSLANSKILSLKSLNDLFEKENKNITKKIENLKKINNELYEPIANSVGCYGVGFLVDKKNKISCKKNDSILAERLINTEKINSLEKKLSNNNMTLRDETNKINQEFNNKENQLNTSIDNVSNQQINIQTEIQDLSKEDLELLKEKKNNINKKYEQRMEEVVIKQNIKLKKLNNAYASIKEKTIEKIDLEKNIIDIREKINRLTRTNPNYIIAKNLGFLFPACQGVEESADITTKCFNNVTAFFWGSISAVVAVTGTILAIGSEVLRSTSLKQKNFPKGKKPFRYLLVGIYKYVRKPKLKDVIVEKKIEKIVEVIKEVPVQKIEYVEVPKIQEVIKKEIVHVPLYTNDEALLNIKKSDTSFTKKTKDE